MSRVFITGWGAVSPAGWGVPGLRAALETATPLPDRDLPRPGWAMPLRARSVPVPAPRPPCLMHPRLRRANPISQHAVWAGLEALGDPHPGRLERWLDGQRRLGVIVCVMTGSVSYSRRFYDETLRDPASASPILFPETVFNAPASHLSAFLGLTTINYTLVGDPGTYLQGLSLAALWLEEGRVDGCVVVGAEELDWLVADASRHFHRRTICAEGAGALLLELEHPGCDRIELGCVTDSFAFAAAGGRAQAARNVRAQLGAGAEGRVLVDSRIGVPQRDRFEQDAWRDWTGARLSPKSILGEGYAAGSAWQCVAAVDVLARGAAREALVSVVDPNQQAIGAVFRSGE